MSMVIYMVFLSRVFIFVLFLSDSLNLVFIWMVFILILIPYILVWIVHVLLFLFVGIIVLSLPVLLSVIKLSLLMRPDFPLSDSQWIWTFCNFCLHLNTQLWSCPQLLFSSFLFLLFLHLLFVFDNLFKLIFLW